MSRITSRIIRSRRRCGDRVCVNAVQRRLATLLLISGLVLLRGSTAAVSNIPLDPFAWLQPVVTVDSAARGRIARGEVVVQILPADDGELGVFAVSRLDADPEMLAVCRVGQFDRGPQEESVSAGGAAVSDPPVLDDLDDLVFEEEDIDSVRDCRQGSCGLKMAAGEIESLRRAADAGGLVWKDAVRRPFREIVVDRVNAYRSQGFAGLSPYVDRHVPVYPRSAVGVLLDHSPYLRTSAFDDKDVRADSYFYWSKEHYGTGKPVITVTHVDVVRPRGPCALRVAMVSTEILATHYA